MSDTPVPPVRATIPFSLLREVAEAASGTRDRPTWFVRDTATEDPKKRGIIQVFDEEPREGEDYTPGSLVIAATQDPGVMPPPPPTPPSWGRLGFSRERSLDLMDVLRTIEPGRGEVAADSVFWTESAVEKFVIPYYASVAGADAAVAIQRVLKVLHRKSPTPAPPGHEGEPQPGEAFALVHIPTSEYFQADLAGTEFLAVVLRPKGNGDGLEAAAVSLDELGKIRSELGWPE
jgi:hypothetical protein